MARVLLVNGSPHKAGCTHTALDAVARELRSLGVESEEFWIGNKPIGGCIACRVCKTRGEGCVFKGDAVQEFLDRANDFDGFVFGSPVHFAGIAGNMKAFMDRAFYSNIGAKPDRRVSFISKPAAGVVSARRMGTTAALEQLDKYFEFSMMPIASSSYWNAVHGNSAEEAVRDEEGIQTMRSLARNMAWMLKAAEAAEAAGVARPETPSPHVSTNFIR